MGHQGHPEDTGLVPMCQRRVEDSGRTQSAQPDVTLRENLHTRLRYYVPKARFLSREGKKLSMISWGKFQYIHTPTSQKHYGVDPVTQM